MSKSTSDKPIPYEKARDELADIVAHLESGEVGLEESLKLWERGEELVKVCQEWLDGAKARIAKAKDA
jgi:exodeoxyribonuclease VII small subunit